MTPDQALYVVGIVAVWYVFNGLLICAVGGVHKWEYPYAIFGVLLLWPVMLVVGVRDRWEKIREEESNDVD